jgi:hypothetical protein
MKKIFWTILGASLLGCLIGLVLSFPEHSFAGQASADRIIALPEVEDPFQICVESGKVYIADKRDIVVYDFKDGRFLKRIGKIGQGPGEFLMGPLRMAFFPNQLIVRDFKRIKIFSPDGIFRGQIEEPPDMGSYPFLPVGRNFVGFPMERNTDGSYSVPSGCIYGPNLKVKKRFFGGLSPLPAAPPAPGSPSSGRKTDTFLIREYQDYIVYKDRIYVADSRKGLLISVFDESGDSLYEIRHAIDKIKVPPSFVDDWVKEWKASKYWDSSLSHLNPIASASFPVFINFKIDGDRIYVITAARKSDLYEVIVMDLTGRILERGFRFPLDPMSYYQFLPTFGLKYDVKGGRFVWFAYNDAKEMYELHAR